ncbi:MAG TPA: DNA polymerase, partial [Acidimicrobiales bacterium]|nr:DNA polymerase [Acidimicrobiales bacterium]
WDPDAVRELFRFLEFNTLYPRFVEATGAAAPPPVATERIDIVMQRVVNHEEGIKAVQGAVSVAAAWEGEEGRSVLLGVAVAAGPDPEATWIPSDLLPADFGAYSTHKAKELMRALDLRAIDLRGLDVDTAIAAYLLDPAESQYLLEDLAVRFLGLDISSPDAPPPGQLDLTGTAPDPAEDAGRRAVAVARLAPVLGKAMESRGLTRLYDEIERPLVRVLARMEKVGVRVDVDLLRRIYDGLVAEGRRLEEQIQDLCGTRFLVNSTQQLRRVLFDELGLQPQKKTKTGFSTDAASLEKLRGLHPVMEPLLRYREVEKLRSTYGESLLGEVAADGRIHASFNQTVARTGRLSSDRPNLHNIPIRTEEGRRIRRAFIPGEGCRFLVADYNQIELRVIAHLAQDPGLIHAFASGEDIHEATASRIFGVAPSAVTIAQRSKAKMVSYGLAYGMESFGLGQRLGIPTEEAAEILNAYFVAFPSVREYMDRTVAEARDRGYTETLFGRRRQIPELQSPNYRLRQAGERQAMNAGIQGLAADIFKVALVRLDRGLEDQGRASRLVLQVHDEVIVEVDPSEEQAVAALTLEAMRGAAELSVPLEVNLSWGDSWADAKS